MTEKIISHLSQLKAFYNDWKDYDMAEVVGQLIYKLQNPSPTQQTLPDQNNKDTAVVDLTLGYFLSHSDPIIKRNAMSIYKRLEKLEDCINEECYDFDCKSGLSVPHLLSDCEKEDD